MANVEVIQTTEISCRMYSSFSRVLLYLVALLMQRLKINAMGMAGNAGTS